MDRRAELLEVIRSVRNRWRQRLMVRGAVLVVAGTLAALFLSASSLEALRFTPAAIISFRLIALAIFAALVYLFIVRPMRREVTDTQGAQFERIPLVAGAHPTEFEGMLFHLDKSTHYYVESNGVKSPEYELSVLDLPTVGKLELEYHFPAYTGLPVQKIDVGGDVAALRGTEVWLKVTPTMSAPDGKIDVNDADGGRQAQQGDGTLTGKYTIKDEGCYRTGLTGPH